MNAMLSAAGGIDEEVLKLHLRRCRCRPHSWPRWRASPRAAGCRRSCRVPSSRPPRPASSPWTTTGGLPSGFPGFTDGLCKTPEPTERQRHASNRWQHVRAAEISVMEEGVVLATADAPYMMHRTCAGAADHRNTARAAQDAVDVPDSVIDLLTGLRNYLQVGFESSCMHIWRDWSTAAAVEFAVSAWCSKCTPCSVMTSHMSLIHAANAPCRTSASLQCMCPTGAS